MRLSARLLDIHVQPAAFTRTAGCATVLRKPELHFSMRCGHSVWPLVVMTTMTVGAMLAGPSASAASGHGGHSSGGGARASTGNPSRGARTIASVVPARPTTPVQRTIIQTCPVRPIGSPPTCPPGQWTPGCRCYCHARGVYFFGQYSFFDEYWFGQYPYGRDTYAAAYQPQIAPDSYYEQMGWQ